MRVKIQCFVACISVATRIDAFRPVLGRWGEAEGASLRSTQSIMQCVGSLIGAGTPVICILPLDLMNFARVDELTRLYTVYLPTTLM